MKIVATHSFRGGSGKTFIALNIAVASARRGIKTIVMDCDFYSPSFQANLTTNPGSAAYGNDFLLGKSSEDEIIIHTSIPNLDVIFSNPRPVLGKGLLESKENIHWKALQRFSELREGLEKKNYERVILDTTPNLSFSSISALAVADSIVLVHRPVVHSIDLAMYILQTIYATLKKSLKPRDFYLIYNQVPLGDPKIVKSLLDNLTKEFKKEIDIKVLGSIPLDPNMDLWTSLLIPKESKLNDDLTQIIEKIFQN